MKKIKICKPRIISENDTSRLTATIKIEGQEDYDLYYEVDNKYAEYLTTEVSDAFLVCLLYYAMEHKLDIHCEGEISEELYYQLTNFLIPAITRNISEYSAINIICRTTNKKFNGFANGTGISCGVDSFYTILKNLKHLGGGDSKLDLTHLAFFNAGASGEYGGDEARKMYHERLEIFKKVSKELKCEFISVDSNMNEFLHQNHEATHVLRTLSIPLALQKLFKVYYFSSTFIFSRFAFKYFDASSYDLLTMPNLSTGNIRFYLVGAEATREEKIEFIEKFDVTKKYLNVCVSETTNCSRCLKCKRTMLNLYLIDKLDEYKDVFDVDYFYKNKKRIIFWAFENRKGIDLDEIVDLLKKRGEIHWYHHLRHFIKRVFCKIKHILKKIFRLNHNKKDA